ncbi:MAG: response regulator [Anaerolineae bacterium]|nr:response regulator [Anaerolineae bacterium]
MPPNHRDEAHPPVKALLIDDSQLQYVMMRDFLAVATRSRITLDWASTFAEGMTLIRAQQHDVYLIDYELDEHNGLDLLSQAIAEGCQVPMILITGHDDPTIDQAAMQAGAVDYLDKADIKPTTLERTIRYVIERAKVAAALRASEARYRTLTELISDFAFSMTISDTGEFESEWITGETFARIMGYTPSDLFREGIFTVFYPEDLGIVREQMMLVLQGQSSTRQLRIVTRSQEIRWLEMYCRPEWDRAVQSVIRLHGIAQDITRRKQAEMAEHEQRILAEALLQTSAALNSTLDVDEILDQILSNVGQVVPHRAAGILMIQASVARIARIGGMDGTLADVLLAQRRHLDQTPLVQQMYKSGQPLIIPNVPDSVDAQASLQGWLDGGSTHADILAIRSIVMTPIHIEGEVIGALMLTSDLPDYFTPVMVSHLQAFSNQMALAIRNARQYEQAQELAALNERQRLARDLHDAVSQTLFSANVIAQTLPRLWPDSPPAMQQELTELHHLTGLALAEMRSLLTELRPRALIDTDIQQLLAQAADVFTRRTRAVINLTIDPAISLPTEVKIVMYRIAQEALNNIAKHAQAAQVDLSIQHSDGGIELCIRDNGRGFDLAYVPPNHFGMHIMQERAESIGAVCQVSSQPGQGTSVTVVWRVPD